MEYTDISLNLSNIFQKYPIFFGYIFGSFGTSRETSLSDIDIAVYINQDYDKYKRFKLRLELLNILEKELYPKHVDLIILNDSPIILNYDIITKGSVIYQKSKQARLQFEQKALKFYFDFKPFSDKFNEYKKLLFLKEQSHG